MIFDNIKVIVFHARSRRTAISRLVAAVTDDKSLQHDIKDRLQMMEEIVPFYVGKNVGILRYNSDEFVFVMGVSDIPVDYDRKKGRNIRIFFLIGYNDNNKSYYIDVLGRIFSIIGQDSFRKEIYSIVDNDNLSDEDKEKSVKGLLISEELKMYGKEDK